MKEFGIQWRFKKDDRHIRLLRKSLVAQEGNLMVEKEKRMKFSPDESDLSVVVGESGIGKTTEICQYVQELREAGKPVIYVSLDCYTEYSFEKFLEEAFGTTNKDLIINTINKKYFKKDIVPTLIIDNIHYALTNGQIDTGLLTFLNGQLYQGLNMSVIMLASINQAAYEIRKCNFML